jgi:2',3'-cyclic-nucleotide 2'-phosphodiesterase (5'-nucleotidase family)
LLTVLHTNDFHGTLDPARAERLAALKADAREGAVYFDSGDAIKAGNLAIPVRPERAWELLDFAGCDASTLGNRETHVLEAAFRAKLAGARHPIVCANLRQKDGARPLPSHVILERGGLRIGVFGVMVPMVTDRMASRHASAFLWDPPLPAAKTQVEELRGQVDCLIALTHIGHRQDLELAASCPELDFVLGGHSHTIVPEPVRVGQCCVCQGGSHGRFVGRYVWKGRGEVEGGLIPLI